MDSITQAALGAAVGGAVLGRRLGRKAILIGAALGTLPDLDVVLDYGDAVANYTEHRGFSHSLFVLSGLGTLMALLAARFAPARDIPLRHWWLFFVLCLTTHPLLDALTTYGTQLWWPLDVRPSAWPIVFIIDPLYTLPLLVGIIVALVSGNGRRGPAWGLALSSLYLVFAFGAKSLVEYRLGPALAERGLVEAPRLVQPTPFNTLLWRVTVVDGDDQHEALVSVFDGAATVEFERFSRGAQWEPAALASANGARLDWFAGPYLRYDVELIDDVLTLTATDLRLGFPGFHPFTFTLLEADLDAGQWHPLASEQRDTPPRANGEALALLGQRIFDSNAPLCLGELVDERWHEDVAC
ncbi:inner membrane protein [Franzmannia pantelleriensis]|uniref:Inner membrane protein n=1 Tax=Franzmannia pantelleriensis TaxID=48727 RepID=A0A1G9RX57_9GAMM|nr:metal-dependent hydrolase [Halomonas pantelleriensis]SDM27801.1 inner membrane protein [Halomonas pantelleriensis]